MATPMIIAKKSTDSATDIVLHSQFANRHGLIAGATGTGKTVTLKVLAEGFSQMGVPVFLADAKGDVSSIAKAGTSNPKFDARIQSLGIEAINFEGAPVTFWDLFGEQGHPIRTTISEIGPLLLAQMLNLNDTQQGVLAAVFRIADDQGLLLIDFKDLKAMLSYVSENASALKAAYGNLSPAKGHDEIYRISGCLLVHSNCLSHRLMGIIRMQRQTVLFQSSFEGSGAVFAAHAPIFCYLAYFNHAAGDCLPVKQAVIR